MQVSVKDGKLVIEIEMKNPPVPSSSGKTLLVATTEGNQKTSVMIEGQPLIVGVNAYIKKPAQG